MVSVGGVDILDLRIANIPVAISSPGQITEAEFGGDGRGVGSRMMAHLDSDFVYLRAERVQLILSSLLFVIVCQR